MTGVGAWFISGNVVTSQKTPGPQAEVEDILHLAGGVFFFFLMHGGEAQDAARPAKTAAHNKVLYSYNNNDTTEQLTHTHRSTVALFTEAYDYAHFNTMVYKKCRLQP